MSFAPGIAVLSAVLALSCDLGVPELGERSWTIFSVPSDGEAGVARHAPLEIQLDRRILPRSVNERSVQLRSGAVSAPADVRYRLLSRLIRITPPSWGPLVRELELEGVAAQGAAGALWLPATRIVDVTAGIGDPARSYLMYKVLGDPHIAGERMPPTGPRLSAEELALLASWIERGAPGAAP